MVLLSIRNYLLRAIKDKRKRAQDKEDIEAIREHFMTRNLMS